MLIDAKFLASKYLLDIKSILHVGAHECEEIDWYRESFGITQEKIIWVEAIPEKVKKIRERLPGTNIVEAVVSNKVGEEVEFKITNNFQSSSFLDLAVHKEYYPSIGVVSTFKAKTNTLENILLDPKLNETFKFSTLIDFPNFIALDIQGADFLALQGLGELIEKIDYIYTEVNYLEMYKGCGLFTEMVSWLKSKGFVLVENCDTGAGWGDAFFIRESKLKLK